MEQVLNPAIRIKAHNHDWLPAWMKLALEKCVARRVGLEGDERRG